jgi:tripartite-type tricarboxylate transporter receptor subunit TctC
MLKKGIVKQAIGSEDGLPSSPNQNCAPGVEPTFPLGREIKPPFLSRDGSASRRSVSGLLLETSRRQLLRSVIWAAALPAVSSIARARTYPSRQVHIVVGFPPGGAADTMARLMAEWLSQQLVQPFVVENRPGAGTNIATDAVVRAPADGYTLLLVTVANTINATLFERLNFDFISDIAPVAGLIRGPLVMGLNPSVPATTIPEFISYAQANPGRINVASPGNGTPGHMASELFQLMTGIDLVDVPYRGGAPALTDLLAGHVDVMFDNLSTSLPYIRNGDVRPLAVTTATRSSVLPDLPTVSEFVPEYEIGSWFGIGVPRNTPAEIIHTLNEAINLGLADPKLKAHIADLGSTILGGSADDFGKLIVQQTEKWGGVIRARNIKPG